jgi:hypothetical protein
LIPTHLVFDLIRKERNNFVDIIFRHDINKLKFES